MAGQHIAKTQKWPVSIQLKKAGQQKASWPVSIKYFFAKYQLTILKGRSQHVDPNLIGGAFFYRPNLIVW